MFDANGTEGLELFTWIVGALLGLVAALTFTHFMTVKKEDDEEDVEEAESRPTETHSDQHITTR